MSVAEAVQNARIRSEIAGTPGALCCGVNGCQVITQGGRDGLRLHRQVIHGSENRSAELADTEGG